MPQGRHNNPVDTRQKVSTRLIGTVLPHALYLPVPKSWPFEQNEACELHRVLRCSSCDGGRYGSSSAGVCPRDNELQGGIAEGSIKGRCSEILNREIICDSSLPLHSGCLYSIPTTYWSISTVYTRTITLAGNRGCPDLPDLPDLTARCSTPSFVSSLSIR